MPRTRFDRLPQDRPDALFAVNDYMAFPALSVLRHKRRLSVPGDVAVVGFAEVPLAFAPEHALTSARQPMEQLVEHAIRLILRRTDNPAPVGVTLDPPLNTAS